MGVNGHWYVEIEKQAYWRGSPKTFVNRYVMSGAQPPSADAETVLTAVRNIENLIYPAIAGGLGVGFVEGRAYGSGKGPAFATIPYNLSLSAATATGFVGATYTGRNLHFSPTLETCLLVETVLTGLSSSGKPVRLRKFYRGITSGTAGVGESGNVDPEDVAGVEALVAPFQTGMGSNNYVVIGNSGAQAAAAPTVQNYLVAHQIPRGKKKKPSSSTSLLQLAEDAAKVRSLILAGEAALALA